MIKQYRIVILAVLMPVFFIAEIFTFAHPSKAEGQNEETDSYIDIYEDTTWHSTDDLNLFKSVTVYPGATLTIEKGAKIKFNKDINGDNTYLSVQGGRLLANGTEREPITITTDSDQKYYIIEFNNGYREEGSPVAEPSFLRFVEISSGGYEWNTDCTGCQALLNAIATPAYAEIRGVPAIMYFGGKVHIENSIFHDNEYADVGVEYDEFDSAIGTDNYLEVVNSNFKKYKDSQAVTTKLWCKQAGGPCRDKILLKDNWYDSSEGPDQPIENISSGGKGVAGYAHVDGWRTNDLIVDPVVVIPGITGSMPSKVITGKMVLDPVLHIYDNLMASFEKNGYTKNKNLFDLPYEWRNSNVLSAEELKNKISEIRTETGISKVDIVAHSMGGLLTRQYIENVGFQNDIDQFITLGTPNKGSPEAYLKWEAAEGFEDPLDKIARSLFALEAHSLGYDSLKDYIQNRVVSVRELLPDYSYLKKASNGEMKDYPDGYPRNEFLENLNSQTNLQKLSKVSFVNIVGKIDDDDTIGKFRVVNSTVSGSWEHGMPEDYYDSSTDQGIEYTSGDETVPLTSANGIAADKKIEIDSVHSDLPTKAQCEVIKELTGKNNCQYVSTFDRAKDLLFVGVFSPIDIQVVAPDGKRMGKNFASGEEYNEIPGAYYSGFDTENEFLTIPNPIDGEYKILTQGTGDGEYKVETTKISEDENDPTKVTESKVEISGTATKDSNEELTVEIAGTQVSTESKDETPPVINIISPENKAYQNNKILDIKYEISDDVSEAEKIEKEIFFDGNSITADKIDLSLEHLGDHNISITATDEAGNAQEAKIEFSDEANIDSIISNAGHYFNLHLITNIGTKNYLQAKLRLIKAELQAIESLQKSKMNKNLKNKMLEIARKTTNLQIDLLIKQLEKEKNLSKTIDIKIRELLMESLESIRF